MSDELAIPETNDAPVSKVYSSIKGDDFATKQKVLSAVVNAVPLADNLGKVINLRHVVIQPVTGVNDVTGEIENYERVVLIDEDGSAFSASSGGIMNSLRTFFGVLGEPDTWPTSVPVTASALKGKMGKFFTLSVVAK